jgi:hypothetical protein
MVCINYWHLIIFIKSAFEKISFVCLRPILGTRMFIFTGHRSMRDKLINAKCEQSPSNSSGPSKGHIHTYIHTHVHYQNTFSYLEVLHNECHQRLEIHFSLSKYFFICTRFLLVRSPENVYIRQNLQNYFLQSQYLFILFFYFCVVLCAVFIWVWCVILCDVCYLCFVSYCSTPATG